MMPETQCPCRPVIELQGEMRHHGETVSDFTLGIRECVQDLQKAAIEVRELAVNLQNINERLRDGAAQFALHDQKLTEYAVAIGANKTKLGVTWAVMFIMLGGIVGMAFR